MSRTKRVVTWAEVFAAASRIKFKTGLASKGRVFGIPTGGSVVAACMSADPLDKPVPGCLVVDDIVDSGRTAHPYEQAGHVVMALFSRPGDERGIVQTDDWVVFPWEHDQGPIDAVRRLIQFAGGNPDSEELKDTPSRVLRSFDELTGGRLIDAGAILARDFPTPDGYGEMVILRKIPFWSLCEHHMLPFHGTATVAYIPGERVVGLSKLARLVDCFARRLQIQERMTAQIVDALEEHVRPRGSACVVEAVHTCMTARGVGKTGSSMVTSALRGAFKDQPQTRAEFLGLA